MSALKRILSFFLSSSLTLILWFYFDNLTDKCRSFLFPKKTILKEIYKKMERNSLPQKIDEQSWLDYLLWGDQNYKERVKTDGIWRTLWESYIKPTDINQITTENIPQQMSTHNAVVQTDEQIKDTAIKSVDYVSTVLTDYFQHNQSWLDYLIIQGVKLLLILGFFFVVYCLVILLFKIYAKKGES